MDDIELQRHVSSVFVRIHSLTCGTALEAVYEKMQNAQSHHKEKPSLTIPEKR
jgi:hypothetical protein